MLSHRKKVNLVKSPITLQKDRLIIYYENLAENLEYKLDVKTGEYNDLWIALKKIEALARTKAQVGGSITGSSLSEIISICDKFK